MKVLLADDGTLERISKAIDPVRRSRRVHRGHADRGRRGRAADDALEATWRRGPVALLRGRLPGAGRPRGERSAPRPSARWTGSRLTTTPTSRAPGSSIAAPSADDRRARSRWRSAAGRCRRSAALLSDRRISSRGDVAVIVGPGLGEEHRGRPRPRSRKRRRPRGRGRHPAGRARPRRRGCDPGSYDAVVGIGGGRTIDVAKYAAGLTGCRWCRSRRALPTTGSPRLWRRSNTTGARAPTACRCRSRVLVDLDYVRRCPPEQLRSGVGDALSNLSAIADWELAERERGERGRRARRDVGADRRGVHPPPTTTCARTTFLTALAEALVLSGLAMARPGASRPCSGASHEISHAVDHYFPVRPPTASGRRRRTVHLLPSRGRPSGRRSTLCSADMGRAAARGPRADGAELPSPCARAPATRPDRFTSSSTLSWTGRGSRPARSGVRQCLRSLSSAPVAQPAGQLRRSSGEHWAGRLYMRRDSPYVTRAC